MVIASVLWSLHDASRIRNRRQTVIRQLVALGDRTLADIGVSRSDISAVVNSFLKADSLVPGRATQPIVTPPAPPSTRRAAANGSEFAAA